MKYLVKTLIPKAHKSGLNPEGMTQEFINALAALFTIANTVRNNLQYIHWYAAGPKFKEIHELTENYYHYLVEDFDFIAELNLQYGLNVGNPLIDYMRGFEEDKTCYDYANAIHKIKSNLEKYINALKEACNQLEALNLDHSRVDEMIGYWEKELNYKLTRML